ncbi:hypothetical protein V2I01_15030 [Micromonospora sp. BRA006-A]|nr:hypothetical protein [Micromonospora sp. BRA006-A]
MKLADYLIDTSALVRLLRDPDVLARWDQQVTAGLLAVCPLIELLGSSTPPGPSPTGRACWRSSSGSPSAG